MRLSASAIALIVGLLFNPGVQAAELPQRWVSAGGALSEWVVALGGESKLVGVDTTSQHPASLKRLPSIGYQRQLSAEGILSLRPQVLVGTEEMGPPTVLAQIRSAGVQVEMFSAQPELPTLKSNFSTWGRCWAMRPRPTNYLPRMSGHSTNKRLGLQGPAPQKAPGVLLLIGNAGGKPLIAGKDTAADWMVQQAGGITWQRIAVISRFRWSRWRV
jgi:iron complex transport system substrate-binding protein